jgi:hypothetical protein
MILRLYGQGEHGGGRACDSNDDDHRAHGIQDVIGRGGARPEHSDARNAFAVATSPSLRQAIHAHGGRHEHRCDLETLDGGKRREICRQHEETLRAPKNSSSMQALPIGHDEGGLVVLM